MSLSHFLWTYCASQLQALARRYNRRDGLAVLPKLKALQNKTLTEVPCTAFLGPILPPFLPVMINKFLQRESHM